MHLGELELCLCAHTGWELEVADNVAECLSGGQLSVFLAWKDSQQCQFSNDCDCARKVVAVPLSLKLGERLPLGVVANDLDVDVASQVELLGTEERVWLGHNGGR